MASSTGRADGGRLAQGGEVQERGQQAGEELVLPVDDLPVLGAAVIAVLVPALETLAEIVVVIGLVHVEAVVAVVRVLIRIGVPVVEAPPVPTVRLAGLVPILIAVVQGSLERVRGVLVRLVIAPAG